MATTPKFTTIPSKGKHWFYDRETGDFALHLDGQFVGWAATPDEAERLLDEIAYERLNHGWATKPPSSEPTEVVAEIPDALAEGACVVDWAITPPPSQPMSSAEVVAEALDELAAIPSPTALLFFHARARLRAGVRVVADLSIFWIDGVAVRHDPANIGWPWRCACARPRCWHGALAEAIALAADYPHLDLAA